MSAVPYFAQLLACQFHTALDAAQKDRRNPLPLEAPSETPFMHAGFGDRRTNQVFEGRYFPEPNPHFEEQQEQLRALAGDDPDRLGLLAAQEQAHRQAQSQPVVPGMEAARKLYQQALAETPNPHLQTVLSAMWDAHQELRNLPWGDEEKVAEVLAAWCKAHARLVDHLGAFAAGKGRWAPLLAAIKESNRFKGDALRVLEEVCRAEGEFPVADLGFLLDWEDSDNSFSSVQALINPRLESFGWYLGRRDNKAQLEPRSHRPGSRKKRRK